MKDPFKDLEKDLTHILRAAVKWLRRGWRRQGWRCR